MGEFRLYVENRVLSSLSAQDIFNFYWISTGLSYDQIHDDDKRAAEFYLYELRNIYIDVFVELLTKQIEKYYQRGRIDTVNGKPAFDVNQLRNTPPQNRTSLIKYFMKQTYRSDMKRRNERWGWIAGYLDDLANTRKPDKISFYIDRINNAVHNTSTLVLDKLPNAQQLLNALDITHKAHSPHDYAQYVSPEIRKLVKQWYGAGVAG